MLFRQGCGRTPYSARAAVAEYCGLSLQPSTEFEISKSKPLALAAVMALTMGLRANELLNRKVRDLDDDCGILWIDQGKTCNARRHLRVPEFVRHHLRHLKLSRIQDAYRFES